MAAFVPQLLPYVLRPIDSIVDANKNTDKRVQVLPILMTATQNTWSLLTFRELCSRGSKTLQVESV